MKMNNASKMIDLSLMGANEKRGELISPFLAIACFPAVLV